MSCAPSAWNRFETSPGEPCGPAIRAGACGLGDEPPLCGDLEEARATRVRDRDPAIAAAARVLILFSSPAPRIDVHVSQTEGARALLGRYVVVTEVAEAGPAARIRCPAGRYRRPHRTGHAHRSARSAPRGHGDGLGHKTYLILLRNGITGKLPVTLAASPPPVSPPVAAGAVCLPELGIAVERYVDNVYAMTFPSPTDPGADVQPLWVPPLTLYCNAASWEFFKDVTADRRPPGLHQTHVLAQRLLHHAQGSLAAGPQPETDGALIHQHRQAVQHRQALLARGRQ